MRPIHVIPYAKKNKNDDLYITCQEYSSREKSFATETVVN